MKDADQMTPEELRELADQKEAEGKIVKKGVLKHDLYESFVGKQYYPIDFGHWLITEEQRNETIEDFKKELPLVLKKGTPFVGLNFENGISWFDDINYGCEDQSEEWANKNLENIVEVGKENNSKNLLNENIMYDLGKRDGLRGLNPSCTSSEYRQGYTKGRRERIEKKASYPDWEFEDDIKN